MYRSSQFESQLDYWLSQLKTLVVSLSFSRQMSGDYPEISHNCIVSNQYLLNIHNHLPTSLDAI